MLIEEREQFQDLAKATLVLLSDLNDIMKTASRLRTEMQEFLDKVNKKLNE